jgi:hypothetical protein
MRIVLRENGEVVGCQSRAGGMYLSIIHLSIGSPNCIRRAWPSENVANKEGHEPDHNALAKLKERSNS